MVKILKKNLILLIVIIGILIAGVIIYLNRGKAKEGPLINFAKCLTEKEAKFYGTYWCGWCKKQKELFGEAAQYLPYIECIDEKTQQMTSQCQAAGIASFPTWEFPEKGKIPGYKDLEKLAELSGCQL